MAVSVGLTVDGWASSNAALRAALLERMVAVLRADERFAAAWLIGSLGRGEEDNYSDVGLVVVVAHPHGAALCARPWRSAGRTTPERLALIRQLGGGAAPVVVHDAHVNAPEGGTHTNVTFDDGTHLDLCLVPLDSALRPVQSRLLFEQVPITVEPAPRETLEQRRELAAQRMALFWIMAMSTAKYRRRGWEVPVQSMLVALHEHVETVRRLAAGEPPRFRRYAPTMSLAATPDAQAVTIRALCDEMEALVPAVEGLGAELLPAPRAQIERWLGTSCSVGHGGSVSLPRCGSGST